MDSLDLPTHQLILDELALNLADHVSAGKLDPSEPATVFFANASSSKSKTSSGIHLSASAARTQISLALFASSISSASLSTTHTVDEATDEHLRPVLEELVKHAKALSSLNIEEGMNLIDWPLLDQLAFALTSALLNIARNAPQHRQSALDAVLVLAENLAVGLSASSGSTHAVATRLVPAFHGFYRALASVPFSWSIAEFARLAVALTPITTASGSTKRLNDALLTLPEQSAARAQADRATRRKPKKPTVRPREDDDDDARSVGSVDTFFSGDESLDADNEPVTGGFSLESDDGEHIDYRNSLLAHYRRLGRPLSGHLVLCGAIEALSSVLAQCLATHASPPISSFADYQKQGLDQQSIDPARAVRADRFDLVADTPRAALHAGEHVGDATAKAWTALMRFPVKDPRKEPQQPQAANGQSQQNGTGSGFLASLPLVGSNSNTAAFGNGDAAGPTTASVSQGVLAALRFGSRVYHDLQRFIESEGAKRGELFIDVYALEILSEALKLGALASIAQTRISHASVDSHTLVRVRTLLSEGAVVYEPVVQSAALQSVAALVRNYPNLGLAMTTQLRRFVTSPLAMFELDEASVAAGNASIVSPHIDTSSPSLGVVTNPVLASAAKCLAICVTSSQNDDLLISTMYTLLNYLGKDSATGGFAAGGAAGSAVSVRSGISRAVTGRDFGSTIGGQAGQAGARTTAQKRLINSSTIAIVSRLALEVNKPDVTALTISMLLQRLRTADEVAEGAILAQLVPLALAGPKSSYLDVVRAFSHASRSAVTGGADRRASSDILAAQLRLARALDRLHEDAETPSEGTKPDADEDSDAERTAGHKELYLVELLQLYAEKGMQLQTSVGSGKASKEETSELTADLAALLPVIAAVLEHDDLRPHENPTPELVSHFRNLWFLSVIFGVVTPGEQLALTGASRSSQTLRTGVLAHALGDPSPVAEALGTISLKTPALVPETSHNYVESDLEFNSVLKRDFSSAALDKQRKNLSALIPSHASEVSKLAFPQVTFLNTIYSLECTRSAMGHPTMILWYFINAGLNASSLAKPMEGIADQVINSFIKDLSQQVSEHKVQPRVSEEVKRLFVASCHRVEKVRSVSRRFLDRLIPTYPSLLCDQDVVVAMLEILTLLRQGCEGQWRDEYAPIYHFRSERADLSFDLTDSYPHREEILSSFLQRTRSYLQLLLARAPVELQSILNRYLSTFDDNELPGYSEMGKSIALDFSRAMPTSGPQDAFLPTLGGWRADASSSFVGELSAKSTYLGEMTGVHLALTKGLVELQKDPSSNFSQDSLAEVKRQLTTLQASLVEGAPPPPFAEIRRLLYRSAALAVALPHADFDILHFIVAIPLRVFTPAAVTTASHVWTWIIGERPELETKVMVEASIGWAATIKSRRGLFSNALDAEHPLLKKTEMSAFDRKEVQRERERATKLFAPHLTLIRLMSSRFQAFRYRDAAMVLTLVRLLQRSAQATDHMSTHALSREVRFALLVFGFRVIQESRLDGLVEYQLRDALYRIAFSWFALSPQWIFGSSRMQVAAEIALMRELLQILAADKQRSTFVVTSFPPAMEGVRLPGNLTASDAKRAMDDKRILLQLLVEDELGRAAVWNNPLKESSRDPDFTGEAGASMTDSKWASMVRLAWRINPHVAVQMAIRIHSPSVEKEAGRLVRAQPHKVVRSREALNLLIEDHLQLAQSESADLKWLLYWAPVTPVELVNLFQPVYGNNGLLLQYAMRALEQHPVSLTFFYVPQIVQALRDDAYGYVEHFIFQTSKISQLFCHQIIWNMKANSYKDDNGEVPDPMKPTLDRMVDLIVAALSGEARSFYNREFGFFNEVTGISGKLKPYIKKSKAEKKGKIDEEVAKIEVDPGVYLPSNPDGVVVDIARKSGRPLQSHAKAPFMLTFKVHRDVTESQQDEEVAPGAASAANVTGGKTTGIDVWQMAIFKVGDDCRQDVLALQCVAQLKNIFASAGLDLYLNPYRVTATGPGMGVIDVVPNATSRDEMGRAQVNELSAFFIQRYGNRDSIAFQQARQNFVSSMAAYSLMCHILNVKDRHNGNIMVDGDGHIVHIDYGFLLDSGPGGMQFEPQFKLTNEFVNLMGEEGLKTFSSMFVRGFLALRSYAEPLIDMCTLMAGADLGCYKGNPTQALARLRQRFALHLNERAAAEYAIELINEVKGSIRSRAYDELQRVTNQIPYAK
ncbi:related to phosphatidylinositol-4-kinase [Ceraceosorus bombacis]|uniref:1-phosphatidylinositol 4-kinase n=1 Tax=Ceraceosorus bombacis TaxID=401625 RepID=A0A0P1BRF0_9BASI|nr:related to phosphatidylinositol-4-kinase [Ceraceosorus bombacis]